MLTNQCVQLTRWLIRNSVLVPIKPDRTIKKLEPLSKNEIRKKHAKNVNSH